jgi:hypothetical protein
MRSAKTLEKLRSHISDAIDTAAFSDARMTQAVLSRANGRADLKQLLTAAPSVARERQSDHIAELARERDDAVLDRDELEGDLENLRRKIDELSAKQELRR